MAVRRRQTSRKPTSVEDLIDRLPERFWSPVPTVSEHGWMVGLRQYLTDLAQWIDSELGRTTGPRGLSRGRDLAPRVMGTIGCPPSEWFKVALTA